MQLLWGGDLLLHPDIIGCRTLRRPS